jgi:hypothetical protein
VQESSERQRNTERGDPEASPGSTRFWADWFLPDSWAFYFDGNCDDGVARYPPNPAVSGYFWLTDGGAPGVGCWFFQVSLHASVDSSEGQRRTPASG